MAKLKKPKTKLFKPDRNRTRPEPTIRLISVRKIKEKKTNTYVVRTKSKDGEKAETIKFDEALLQGTILGGHQKLVNYDSITDEHKRILVATWGSVEEGIKNLKELPFDKVVNVFKPLVDLQNSMQSVHKALMKTSDEQRRLRKILNPLGDGRNIGVQNRMRRFREREGSQIRAGTVGGGIMSLPNRFPLHSELKGRKPNGAIREPLTGVGIHRYMKKKSLKNPVDIAKHYPKKPTDLSISGFINLRFLCEQMNVNVEEAFLYICEGMKSNNTRWLKHRVTKEHNRGGLGIVNLVDYYDDKVRQHKSSNKSKYTIGLLYKSIYYTNWCLEYGVKKMSYTDFTKKFKEFQKLTKAYKDKLPKGLLSK